MPDVLEAVALVNEYAPEHLILVVRNAEQLAGKITNAGSVFIGNYAPESAGDYASGTNHTLPTNGFAKNYSGVSVDSFVKKISFQQLTAEGLQSIEKTVATLARAMPDLPMVINHLAKPRIKERGLEDWLPGFREAAAFPNVSCKLSGMVTEANWMDWRASDFTPYLDVVVEAFGVERVMFGSDWPVCLVAAAYAQAMGIVDAYAGRFSAAEREKLFCENAARFYGLELPAHGSAA